MYERKNHSHKKLICFTVFSICLLRDHSIAQSSAQQVMSPEKITIPSGSLPIDPEKFIKSVSDSYYHPDDLEALDCDVSIDWSGLLGSMKVADVEARLAILNKLQVRSRAIRGKTPDITFDWNQGSLSTKDQMEGGFKQMISSFYQMYWPLVASFPLKNLSEIKKIAPENDGEATIYTTASNVSVALRIDKEHQPTRYEVESPVMKGIMELKFLPSPNPIPGDLQRITGIKGTQQIGTSTINLELTLDYQTVGGFNIPYNVTFGLGPSLTVPMKFSNCSVSKTVTVSPPSDTLPAKK